MTLTPGQRHRMVVDAAVYGIRSAARTYGVSTSVVSYWLNHPKSSETVTRARESVARVAKELREEGAATTDATNCWTCHTPITSGGRNGRARKFCNQTCNNAYKGIRDSYKKGMKPRDMVWPYGSVDDPIITRVNELIPRNLPEQIRAEACQELVVALLSGEEADSDTALASECIARARRGYQFSSQSLSLELPPPGSPTQIPLKDRLDENAGSWEQIA